MHYALRRDKAQSVVMSLRLFFGYSSPATEDNDLLDAAAKLAWRPEDNKEVAN